MKNYQKAGRVIANALQFCWPYVFTNVLVVATITTVNLLINFVSKDIINQLTLDTRGGKLSSAFVGLIIIYAFFYLFQKTSGFLGSLGYNFYKLKVEQFFQDVFNWKSYTYEQEKFFDSTFLEKYSFARKGINRISSHINSIIYLMFSNIATIVTTIIVFLSYSPILIVFMLVVAIVSYFLNRYIYNKEYLMDKEQIHSQKIHDYYKGLLVDKRHAKELRIYNTKNSFYSSWQGLRDKLRTERLALAVNEIKLNSTNSVFKLLVRAISTAFLLAGAFKDNYDVGTFILLFGFVNSFCERIDSLTRSIVTGTYKDVKYIVDFYDFVYPLTNEEMHKARKLKKEVFDMPWGQFRELELNAVSYQYPNSNSKAIDTVSLSIKRGEIISILGYNGSGKTTLSKLISGCLFPQTGEVTFNGVKITEENKMLLHTYFGFAPQEFSRFSLSIDEYINLRCSYLKGIDLNKKPFEVYQQLSMYDFLDKYPDGADTILGKSYSSKGVDLSGGEWQFLNIASSFAGDPEILLLDEPTASIDPVKEEQIMQTLHNNLSNRTVILISHRLGFARFADKIILMEHGRIKEQGTHDELMKSKGAYFNLFRQQKELYE